MSIKDLIDKFKNTPPDRTLAKDLLIEAKVINVPKKHLLSGYITLEDNSGILDAVAPKNKIYEYLSSCVDKEQILKLKGRLDKTEYGNIAFEIEEILE